MQFIPVVDILEAGMVISELNNSKLPVTLDIETTGLNRFTDELLDVAVCNSDDRVYLFSKVAAKALTELDVPYLIGHNIRFDLGFLKVDSCYPKCDKFLDTSLLYHLIDENDSKSLDNIVKKYFNDDYKTVFWSKVDRYTDATEADKLEYACKDALYTFKLSDMLMNELLTVHKVPTSLIEHVHELAYCLFTTELKGIAVDIPYLVALGVELQNSINEAALKVRELVGGQISDIEYDNWAVEIRKRKSDKGKRGVLKPEFNLDSPKQLQQLIYGKLELPVVLSKKRSPTLDDSALEKLKSKHPVIEVIRKYRGDKKIYGSFIEGTLERQVGGRIYPEFNINGTVTGRISSRNPNMQQLPREGGIRGMYIPDTGYKFISCDYAQLEIVLAAHFSNDPVLLDLITSGRSMHDHTSEALGLPRQMAKTINFLTIYGGSEYKLSKVLGCSLDRAKQLLDKLWDTYRGLKVAIDRCHKCVETGTPIINPFGRVRRFPKKFDNVWDKERVKRQSFNSLVQGTGADLTHSAVRLIDKTLDSAKARVMFPVHDEIVVMSKDEYCYEASEIVTSSMIKVGKDIKLLVPLSVECSAPMDRWSKT